MISSSRRQPGKYGEKITFSSLSEHNKYWVMDNLLGDTELQQELGLTIADLDRGIDPDQYLAFYMNNDSLSMMPKI